MMALHDLVAVVLVSVLLCNSVHTLDRNGKHVCSTRISNTETYSTRQSYSSSYTKSKSCGFWGGWTCTTQHYRVSYRYVTSRRTVHSLRYVCCDGYKAPYGSNECTEPICRPRCIRGTCKSPNLCRCVDGYHGQTCQYNTNRPSTITPENVGNTKADFISIDIDSPPPTPTPPTPTLIDSDSVVLYWSVEGSVGLVFVIFSCVVLVLFVILFRRRQKQKHQGRNKPVPAKNIPLPDGQTVDQDHYMVYKPVDCDENTYQSIHPHGQRVDQDHMVYNDCDVYQTVDAESYM